MAYYLATVPVLQLLLSLFTFTNAAIFEIRNNCPYTVWAAATPGGGRRLNEGETWQLDVANDTKTGRVWGRTNCTFDGSGRGRCQTGDCDGVLECSTWGVPPNTLAEYALNQFGNRDFYDISLVDGFNIPMEFSPNSTNVQGSCAPAFCTADINERCPEPLRVPGGCNNPCTTFNTSEYCCTNGPCPPTNFSNFFKQSCPDAYINPQDGPTSTFTCSGNSNYRLAFCP